MISELDRFHTAVRESPQLLQGLQSANSPEDLVGFAASQGYNFSARELETWGTEKVGSELTDADLETVAGGQNTGTAGGGTNSNWRKIRLWLVGVHSEF
jgi:predicted ribosomally synthesized peptide with nif11-like leader